MKDLGSAPPLNPAEDARSVGREGMATVWDHAGRYLGCIGVETWQALVAKGKAGLGGGETGAQLPTVGGTSHGAEPPNATAAESSSAGSPQCEPCSMCGARASHEYTPPLYDGRLLLCNGCNPEYSPLRAGSAEDARALRELEASAAKYHAGHGPNPHPNCPVCAARRFDVAGRTTSCGAPCERRRLRFVHAGA